MPATLALYITKYGYLAIFSLVFLQEIGVPNPVPNELVLLFSGYLASIGKMNLYLVIFAVVMADFIGTTLLFSVSYYFGKRLIRKKPKWIPFSKERLDRLTHLISKKDWWGIYLGRLIPYVRGYASVAAGILQVSPFMFVTTVFFSAITWSGGYAVLGNLLGSHFENIVKDILGFSKIVYIVIGIAVITFFGPRIYRRLKRKSIPS